MMVVELQLIRRGSSACCLYSEQSPGAFFIREGRERSPVLQLNAFLYLVPAALGGWKSEEKPASHLYFMCMLSTRNPFRYLLTDLPELNLEHCKEGLAWVGTKNKHCYLLCFVSLLSGISFPTAEQLPTHWPIKHYPLYTGQLTSIAFYPLIYAPHLLLH